MVYSFDIKSYQITTVIQDGVHITYTFLAKLYFD
jgi:hypothetical protein